jgi:hypothetical protein
VMFIRHWAGRRPAAADADVHRLRTNATRSDLASAWTDVVP